VPNTIALTAPFQPIMRHDKQPPEPREIEVPEFTETPAFRSYVRDIERLIRKSPRGVTTAAIHAALGKDRQRWTLIAIRHIADVQESWVILPTRYSIAVKRVKRAPYGAIPAVK
jgi:hypothetical protein